MTKHIAHINLARGFRGGERQTALLVEELARRGLQQSALIRADSPLHKYLHGIPKLRIIGTHRPYWTDIYKFKDVDLLHAHEAKAAHWCQLANLLLNVPYIITRRVPNNPSRGFITQRTYKKASAVVALSRAISKVLKNTFADDLEVSIIPSMAAELSNNEEVTQVLRSKYQGKFLVGHIGALVNKHKGQSYLISAALNLVRKYPQMHFVLLGEGRDREDFERQIGDNQQIELAGFTTDVRSYISCMDLFVFPSLEEGLGSTLLDVMQAEVPIVASRVDGIPDVIEHEQNGLLIPAGSSEAIEEAIETLYRDKSLAKKLAQKGKQRVKHYTPEVIGGRYLALYKQTLDGNNNLVEQHFR